MSLDLINSLIGVPFKEHGRDRNGMDCWGPAYIIYKEKFGIDLPDLNDCYDTVDEEGCAEIVKTVSDERMRAWKPVDKADVSFGDIVLFNISGNAWHVGVMVDKRQMVHCVKHADTCLEKIDTFRWKKRIEGFYRHESRTSNGNS